MPLEYAKLLKLYIRISIYYAFLYLRWDILRNYCSWLFPILERTEELSVPKGSEWADRYIGYMAETLYFMHNRVSTGYLPLTKNILKFAFIDKK